MTILHISDTHGRHREIGVLAEADVLVHSGDFTLWGSDEEALDFLEWFCDLPHRHKILVAGNHDFDLQDANIEGLPDNVHWLSNSGVNIDGIRFYGAPMVVGDDGRRYELIPTDVDVLVTHRPPMGILDEADGEHWGSAELLCRLAETKVRLHLFGHVHSCYGTAEWHGIRFSNGSVIDDYERIAHEPRLITL